MATAALGGLGQLIGLTVAGLLVRDLLGSATWVGTANAAASIGTAVGSITLAGYMQRRGRRLGLSLGYGIGVIGALLVVVAARWHSYPMLLGALVLYGVANTANQQSRFAAADVSRPDNRGRLVGLVVWASTLGVVLGPKVAGPIGERFEDLADGAKGGAFAGAAVAFALATVVLMIALRPDPLEISRQMNPVSDSTAVKVNVDVRECFRRPKVRLATLSLTVGQIVMVAVMSVTNVHLADNGYTLSAIGTVLSGHVFGMYAPSPISGWLCDRLGRLPVILGANLVMILGALLAAAADPANHGAMIMALFLLGIGWNGNFVAGSALLTDAITPAERPRLQGTSDMITYAASAGAALSAGLLVGTTGYSTMAVCGAAIAGLACVVVVLMRRAIQPDTQAV